MPKTVTAFATQNLESSEALHVFGDTVLSDGLGEGGPWGRVGELGAAGEQGVVALGAHVDTCFEVVLVDLASKKLTERHAVYL